VLASGSDTFTADVEGTPDYLGLTVVVTDDGDVNLGGDNPVEQITLSVTNENTFDVTLGFTPDGGGAATPAVKFEATATAPPGSTCGVDDLDFDDTMDWEGDPLPAGATKTDVIDVSLLPGSATECAGASLEITITVSGETVDEEEEEELVTGTAGV
jgi:hypothetical protein